MEDLSKLLFELSNEDRLRILEVLREDPKKLTAIASSLELTVQETSRHLSRMAKSMLIQKGSDGAYFVTEYGNRILEVLPSFTFLIKNQDYFMTHTFGNLPQQFISRLGDLANAELADNAIVLFQHVDSLISKADEYVWILADQALSSTFPLLVERLEAGVEVRVTLPSDIGVPKIPEDKLPDFGKYIGKLMEPRHLDNVSYVVILSESRAILALPELNGQPDYLGFRFEDKSGHQWCHDVFLYFWEKAFPVRMD